jgi:3',5'-cyclic AMP phosphodiesterase CpdA
MTETFTLVHLSDVHLAPVVGMRPRHWNVKRGLGYINWRSGRRRVHLRSVADRIAADARAQNPDHIAVTGDLANLGLPGEYAAALAWLKALGDASVVSVVPGNHDIYTGRLGGETCLVTWAPFMSGSGREGGDGPAHFPYVRTQGPVALIGLNSAVPTPPFVAAGRLGRPQIDALGAVLERLGAEGYIRVVLIHHPPLPGQAPPRRALADAEALAAVLDGAGAELVLHGHNHRQMMSWREHSAGGIPVLGVASASASRAHAQKGEPLAGYHVLRIRRDEGAVRIECETRGLATPEGEIVSLGRQMLTAPTA